MASLCRKCARGTIPDDANLFGTSFLDGIGIWHDPEWIVISLFAAVLVWLLAYE